MALLTQKAILATFQQMLEEMPFDKITVSALVRRCGVSSNTFYYHYQDIFALLEVWLEQLLRGYLTGGADWREATKALMRDCRAHPAMVYHLFNSLSRDRLERYVFTLSDDVFERQVGRLAQGRDIPPEMLRSITSFCRYAYVGFFLQFLWDKMSGDIDRSVEQRGVLFRSGPRGALFLRKTEKRRKFAQFFSIHRGKRRRDRLSFCQNQGPGPGRGVDKGFSGQ